VSSTCHSCGAPVDDQSGRCRKCGGATTRRWIIGGAPAARGAAPPPVDITLPCLVPEARYPVAEVWTHGQLYLTDLGMYFLAESDGPWSPEKLSTVGAHPPGQPAKVGEASYFLPLNKIEKIQHSRLTSHAIFTSNGKKPLRLSADGWRLLDAFASRVGIPSSS